MRVCADDRCSGRQLGGRVLPSMARRKVRETPSACTNVMDNMCVGIALRN